MDLAADPINPSLPNQNDPAGSFTVGSGFRAAGFKTETAVVSPQTAGSEASPPLVPPEKPKKEKSSKNVIVVAVLLLFLAGLVASFGKIRSFISSAQGSCEPENLSEANITASSAEIIFQTGKACQMEVAYGTSKEALLLQVPETTASLNHRIRLAPLLASTTYYYQVIYDGKKLGQVRSFLTKSPSLPTPTVAEPTVVTPTSVVTPTTEPLISPEASSATSSARYTLQDFQAHFGTSSAEFDLDKNGVVNNADWLLYQNQ